VVKIVLIVLAIVVFLGLVSLASCVYFVYRAKQKVNQFEKQAGVTFPLPTGTPQAPTQPGATGQAAGPAVNLDLPVYPGATPTRPGTSVTMGAGSMKSAEYVTTDSVDQVVAFYRGNLGSNALVTQNGQQALVQVSGSNGYANVAIAPDSSTGKTKITISSIGK
jgi:hypothetical protein